MYEVGQGVCIKAIKPVYTVYSKFTLTRVNVEYLINLLQQSDSYKPTLCRPIRNILKTQSCHYANFIVTDCSAACYNDKSSAVEISIIAHMHTDMVSAATGGGGGGGGGEISRHISKFDFYHTCATQPRRIVAVWNHFTDLDSKTFVFNKNKDIPHNPHYEESSKHPLPHNCCCVVKEEATDIIRGHIWASVYWSRAGFIKSFNHMAYSVNIGSGKGLVPDDTKPLPEAVLTYHQ